MLAPLGSVPIPWSDLARAFHVEGTDRDIILPGADLDRWMTVMAWIDELERSGAARVERQPDPLPELATFLPKTEGSSADPGGYVAGRGYSLTIFVDDIRIDCPFYEQPTIEFQLDPAQIRSADDAAVLLGFVQQLAATAGLPAYLTEDNMHDLHWLRFDPSTDTWEWTPLPA